MEISGLGGGLMFAAAAGLWLVYLMPTWFKRREYLATERNAVRLQQTLRVLAETAEVPAIVRADTSGRSIAAQERALREQNRRAEAIARSRTAHAARTAGKRAVSDLAAPLAEPTVAIAQAQARALTTRRLRRTRLGASLFSLVALVVVVVQLALVVGSGVTVAALGVLGFSSIGLVIGVAALARLATVAKRRSAPNAAPLVVRAGLRSRMADFAPLAAPVAPTAPAEWTPVPVPKPLYLSRAVSAAPAAAIRETAAAVERSEPDAITGPIAIVAIAAPAPGVPAMVAAVVPAAATAAATAVAVASNLAARMQEGTAAIIPITAGSQLTAGAQAQQQQLPPQQQQLPPQQSQSPEAFARASRFARMGIVEPWDIAGTDIDAALRRRRAAS